MKKTLTFYLLFVVGLISVNAQEYNTYDISNYYTPDIRRNKLDLTFSGQGHYTDNEFSSSESNSYSGDFQAQLRHLTHTRKRYSELGGAIAAEASGNINESENVTSKFSHLYPELYLYSTNRLYKPSNAFISLGGGGRWSTLKDYSFYENITQPDIEESTERSSRYVVNVQVGAGQGRLESVEDARQAIYILDNLSRRGVLTRRLTDDEIFTLSQLISSVKNKRFFDSRLHLIEEISRVDSFFVKNDLLESSDASYFTTLYDYWQYGALFERLSGKEFHTYLSVDLTHEKYDVEFRDEATVNYYDDRYRNLNWVNQFSYEKPINLYWQNAIYASFSIGYLQQRLDRVGPDAFWEKNLRYSLSGSYSWHYYPNSRTNLSAWANQQVAFTRIASPFEGERSYENGGKSFTTRSSLNGSLNYYISPQLRLSASVSALFDFQKGIIGVTDDDPNYSNTILSGQVTLTYSIY
jgi:hypothetical protein